MTWSPTSDMEKADEGFLSFGATQSPVDPKQDATGGNAQTHLHQSVLTWVGWSLSVPQPNLTPINDTSQNDKGCKDQASQRHLAVRPNYYLDRKIPPLRFDTKYVARCRITDLAGNSLSPDFALITRYTHACRLRRFIPFHGMSPIAPHTFFCASRLITSKSRERIWTAWFCAMERAKESAY
jgi:hypothetical protein